MVYSSLALRKILGKPLTSVSQQGLRNLFLENCFLGNSAFVASKELMVEKEH